MSRRNGKRRKCVTEIFQREFELVCQDNSVFDGIWAIAKQLSHFGGALEAAFGVLRKQRASGIQMRVMTQTGEHIEDGAFGFGTIQNSIGSEQGKAKFTRELNQ